jgi:hypothetical protein
MPPVVINSSRENDGAWHVDFFNPGDDGVAEAHAVAYCATGQ